MSSHCVAIVRPKSQQLEWSACKENTFRSCAMCYQTDEIIVMTIVDGDRQQQKDKDMRDELEPCHTLTKLER